MMEAPRRVVIGMVKETHSHRALELLSQRCNSYWDWKFGSTCKYEIIREGIYESIRQTYFIELVVNKTHFLFLKIKLKTKQTMANTTPADS